MISTTRFSAPLLLVTTLLSACGSYDMLASSVAHAQVVASEAIRRDGAVSYALCRDEAAYAYLEMELGIGRAGPVAKPATFAVFYDSEKAANGPGGIAMPWAVYCRELDSTGAVYHEAVLALRNYALAIQLLSDAKDFDGSGIQRAGNGAASIAGALSAPDAVASTAKGIGSAASSFATFAVRELRKRELKRLVQDAAPKVDAVVGSLDAYLVALESQRVVLASYRNKVLAVVDARRDQTGAFTAAADGALAFDLAIDGGRRLLGFQERIAADRKLLAHLGKAHGALAAAAASSENECAAKDAAGVLLRALEDLNDQRPQEP